MLADGRVLVVGGAVPLAQPVQLANGATANYDTIASAEIFDSGTKTWSSAGRLRTTQGFVSLVALPNGMALAAGGCAGTLDAGGVALRAAELFDPITRDWTSTTSLPEPRCGGNGMTLKDGRAFIVGGTSSTGSVQNAVVYDFQSHRWTTAGTIDGGASTPVVLADGMVMLPNEEAGPSQGRVQTAFIGAQIFDPATGDWNYATTTSVSISSLPQDGPPIAVALPNGSAIVLLDTVALAFHPEIPPPADQLLDNAGLTGVLLATCGILALLLAAGYIGGRRA